ncbi:MAG: PPOX class F420-dependent oxidoreductase [Microlunatus sp.]|nr:PPOX class F420-dependent oxidoreductase [Microlunatus sp.]
MSSPSKTPGEAAAVRIPERFGDLLTTRAVAIIATLGRTGAPQQTPIWFVWDGEHVRFSLVEGRQKLRNLRRDPRVAVTIIDPAQPTRYVELRGEVTELQPDPEQELEKAAAIKYAGEWTEVEPGVPRFAATLTPSRITSQG